MGSASSGGGDLAARAVDAMFIDLPRFGSLARPSGAAEKGGVLSVLSRGSTGLLSKVSEVEVGRSVWSVAAIGSCHADARASAFIFRS